LTRLKCPFRVEDRVEIIKQVGSIKPGITGTVRRIDDNIMEQSFWIVVQFDRKHAGYRTELSFKINELKLLSDSKWRQKP